MKKKSVFLIISVTAVVMFIITTCFYVTPAGRVIYYELSSRVTDSDLSKIARAEYIMEREFMGSPDRDKMMDAALTGYLSEAGDRYTDYLPAYLYRNMTQSLEGSYKGIGVTLTLREKDIVVKQVTQGSPAFEAGIEPEDVIVSINGTKYDKDTYSDALNLIKSTKEGESVLFEIRRGEEFLKKEIKIATISRGYVEEKTLDGGIGYIRIKTFSDDIVKDFEKAIENLGKNQATSLILDLRSNPGGSLGAVVEMTDLLIGEGVITTIKDKDGSVEEYTSDKNELELPICVLINSQSASASEIMASALSYHKNATLVGEKTFGKGVVQAIYEFNDDSAMRLTIAKYFTPSGECIDGVGISPDIEALMPDGEVIPEEKIGSDEDVQLEKAKEVLKKADSSDACR